MIVSLSCVSLLDVCGGSARSGEGDRRTSCDGGDDDKDHGEHGESQPYWRKDRRRAKTSRDAISAMMKDDRIVQLVPPWFYPHHRSVERGRRGSAGPHTAMLVQQQFIR
jgi:hypothetical protein